MERKGRELGVDVLEEGQEMDGYIVRRKLVQTPQGNFKCVARASMCVRNSPSCKGYSLLKSGCIPNG